jgi:hypothetical protein
MTGDENVGCHGQILGLYRLKGFFVNHRESAKKLPPDIDNMNSFLLRFDVSFSSFPIAVSVCCIYG